LLQEICEGIILILPHDANEKVKNINYSVPVVMIDHRGSTVNLPAIDVDNYRGARLATEHLIALGHQSIGFITGKFEASLSRLRGYQEALLNANLVFDEALIQTGDFTQPSGFKAANKLLALGKPPTAIFAANDLSAFGVMEAIKEKGLKIPHDISVIGFDDIPMASQVYPALTTIRQPLLEMGVAAARMILAKLKGVEPPSKRITLSTELIRRASTGPWPKNVPDQREVRIS
ncbi:MAG: substrate-binding domain-containing protein, partial [Deinococcales bacterium]